MTMIRNILNFSLAKDYIYIFDTNVYLFLEWLMLMILKLNELWK